MRASSCATLRTGSLLISWTIAFVAWVWGGVLGDWRHGVIVAAVFGLIGAGIAALTYIIEGRIGRSIITTSGLALLPIASLVWTHYHGWAWLWTIGWITAANSAYNACRVELIYRTRPLSERLTLPMLSQLGVPVATPMSRALGLAIALCQLAFLELANLDASKGLVASCGVVALCVTSVGWVVGICQMQRMRHQRWLY